MGETTSQIETRIEQTREDLGSNLRELETRVRTAADWREHYRGNPLLWVGLAFGSGVFLGVLSGRRDLLQPMETLNAGVGGGTVLNTGRARQKVLDSWEDIKSALVGVATARVMDFLGEAVEGFDEHRKRSEADRARPFQGRASGPRPASSSGN